MGAQFKHSSPQRSPCGATSNVILRRCLRLWRRGTLICWSLERGKTQKAPRFETGSFLLRMERDLAGDSDADWFARFVGGIALRGGDGELERGNVS